jgi:hypothetical protein
MRGARRQRRAPATSKLVYAEASGLTTGVLGMSMEVKALLWRCRRWCPPLAKAGAARLAATTATINMRLNMVLLKKGKRRMRGLLTSTTIPRVYTLGGYSSNT